MKKDSKFDVLIALLLFIPVLARADAESISPPPTAAVRWQVISSGGSVSGGGYRIQQAIGQTAAGFSNPAGQRCNSGFEQAFQRSACCVGITGNIDCDLLQGIDISDLSTLIDYLYISFTPLCCPGEANTDGDPLDGIDISDLSALIDYLYISFTPTASCM